MDDSAPQEAAPFSLRSWPDEDIVGANGYNNKRAKVSKPMVILFLNDGSSYGVTDYWLANGELHYVTTYGGENKIPVEELDLQRTVDANATRGVNFTLYNEPARKQ